MKKIGLVLIVLCNFNMVICTELRPTRSTKALFVDTNLDSNDIYKNFCRTLYLLGFLSVDLQKYELRYVDKLARQTRYYNWHKRGRFGLLRDDKSIRK